MPARTLAIFIFDDVEVLDFCGPFEVFSVAATRREPPAFRVLTVAETPRSIRTRGGLVVTPHHAFADCPQPDIVLVPGGAGTRPLLGHPPALDWIRSTAEHAELVLSVCTGALLLAKIGLLDRLEATTHHASLGLLRELSPTTTVRSDRRFVDQGRIVTSGGIAAGIDMALAMVARLEGDELAHATAEHMEYPWPATFFRSSPNLG